VERRNVITLLESLLGIEFPSAYQDFLSERGSLVVDGYSVAGLSTEEVPQSILELTSILRLKRDDLPNSLVAICIDVAVTKALCLDLGQGNEDDAPLVEVDLTKRDFVEPKPLGKTFREWIEEHEAMAKRFAIAWNRVNTRRKETAIWQWDTIINRVKDYVIGLAAFRYNPVLNYLEVDELYPLNQPHVKKDEPIKILMNEIFARARDYGGSLQVGFTRDIREDESGRIPEELKGRGEQRRDRPVPEELADFARKYGVTFEGAGRGLISNEEGVKLWFASLELPAEIGETIYQLEKAGYASREIVAEVISKGIWTKEELTWIFLNAPRPEALLLGTDLPEDRLFYSESLSYGRAVLLATRFKEAIIADLTKGVSIEEIEKEKLRCTLEPDRTFWVSRCSRNFQLPQSWIVDKVEKPVEAGEPVLLLCRPRFPSTSEYDTDWIKEQLKVLLDADVETRVRCLLLSHEFTSLDYSKDVGQIEEIAREANERGLTILFAPSRMYLFFDEEIHKRMRRARGLKHFRQRRGQLKLQFIEVPKECWDVPESSAARRGIQNASKSAEVFAEQIVQSRDTDHYRMRFSLMCEVVEREALQNHRIIAEIEGDNTDLITEALRCDSNGCEGLTFPYIRPEKMSQFVERVRIAFKTQQGLNRTSNDLVPLLENVRGGLVVVVKPWQIQLLSPQKTSIDEVKTNEIGKALELPPTVIENIDTERKRKRYIGNRDEIDRAHEHFRNALKNRVPLSLASIRSHVFVQVSRDYVYRLPVIEPHEMKIAYGDGTEGMPFPVFSLPRIEEPRGRLFPYPVGLVSLRHMQFDRHIERSLIRNREIQIKETSADQENLAFRRTYEHVDELIRFIKGDLRESELSIGLRALLIRKNKLRDTQWEGLELHIFQSTGLEPACVGAYRAIIELLKKYRGQLVAVPVLKFSDGYREVEKWY